MKKHSRRPKSEYLMLLKRKEDGGLTYAELSDESGVPACTLQYWAKKLREGGPGAADGEGAGAFVQVDLPDRADAAIEVVLDGDVRVSVRQGFDPLTLRAVIDALAC